MRRRRADRLTDCLNFGNPEKPEIGYQLAQAIEGIAQAADALGIPVVSGNVSLYNETDGRPIPPTPVAGCVGIVEDVRFVPSGWQRDDAVLLATAPEASLAAEAALIRFLWKAAPLLSRLPRRRLRRPRGRDRGGDALERAADVDLVEEPVAGAALLAARPATSTASARRAMSRSGRSR